MQLPSKGGIPHLALTISLFVQKQKLGDHRSLSVVMSTLLYCIHHPTNCDYFTASLSSTHLKRQWWDACSFKKMIFHPSFKDLYALLIMRYCSVHMLHHCLFNGLKRSPTVPFITKVNICVRCDWTKIWGSVYLQWHFIQMWMKWCLIKK